ncbi:hypothetical protein [Methyloceanibacter sp.]|uniref:hypothetical protein n=1 Tax=Methyloceanibacter sp. TaxID=1965321 RepID=UPI002CF5603A|nr:hypothetical protein [Methyloceanibacter sp.]HML93462.1 hypothetical protein [Methyloceanibacter sp.]
MLKFLSALTFGAALLLGSASLTTHAYAQDMEDETMSEEGMTDEAPADDSMTDEAPADEAPAEEDPIEESESGE